MLRSWMKTFAPHRDNKHDIILDKGGGPEYLCRVINHLSRDLIHFNMCKPSQKNIYPPCNNFDLPNYF